MNLTCSGEHTCLCTSSPGVMPLLIQRITGWAVQGKEQSSEKIVGPPPTQLRRPARLNLYASPTPWASYPAGVLTPSPDNNLCDYYMMKRFPFSINQNLYALIFQTSAPCSH